MFEVTDVVRDARTSALVLSDKTAYESFMSQYNQILESKTSEKNEIDSRFVALESATKSHDAQLKLILQMLGQINHKLDKQST